MASSYNCIFLMMVMLKSFLNLQRVTGVYITRDNYLLACGTPYNGSIIDYDQRTWSTDVTYVAAQPASVPASIDSNLQAQAPFFTARIFPYPVKYTFPVKPGRHWLRLYFYPFPYSNYDPKDAVVTVKTESYLLISNLQILNETKGSRYAYLKMEYSINISSSPFQIFFIPGAANKSFAMVNGIELVSIPNDILNDTIYDVFAGQFMPIPVAISTLQTMYRVNVGGEAINATNDDLYREWVTDTQFIPFAATGISYRTSAPIQYGILNTYTAPEEVYQTDRSMTNNNFVNLNFNLTWWFPVDVGFGYYIKLHFCEFHFSNQNQRKFNIYLNGQLSEANYDVLAITRINTATTLDFFIRAQENISLIVIALHPSTTGDPEYHNALLNGLEIFKLNDSSGKLQGDTHFIYNKTMDIIELSDVTSLRPSKIAGISIGLVTFVILIIVALVCMNRQKRKGSSLPQRWLTINKYITRSPLNGTSVRSNPPARNTCHKFTFHEIQIMSNNFNNSKLIGVGGFGKVYLGALEDGTNVAIKCSKPGSRQGIMEFKTEIEMLPNLRHQHLVPLIGFCEEKGEMILVYEYMANGPLRGHLYGNKSQSLSWKRRLQICIGAARGLHYLHTGHRNGIIHRDVKTTNILLDENLVAKVSDFGLSKIGPNLDETHVSTIVKGSFGYFDPEYFRKQQLTVKSDVYSFGVVLLEVLCARPVICPRLPQDEINLVEWAMQWHKKGLLDQIIDPSLRGKINLKSFQEFTNIAQKCLLERGSDRPTMGDVLWSLEHAMQLHESSSDNADVDANEPLSSWITPSVPEQSDYQDNSIATYRINRSTASTITDFSELKAR